MSPALFKSHITFNITIMETTKPEEASTQIISIEPETKTHPKSNEASKNFFKKVFETTRYNLYEKLFNLESEPFQNYLTYNELKKGEKRIVEFYIEENGVKINTILPIERNGEYTIGNNKPFFTPLSSDTKKNVRRGLKTISSDNESRLIELAISIVNHGIKEPKHEIELYNVDYNALQDSINNACSKVYSKEETITGIALIGHFERDGELSFGKQVWGAIFRHADYKQIIQILIDKGVITKTANAIVGWCSNKYTFNAELIDETYTITDGKVLTRIKNSKITFSKNTQEEKLRMAQTEECYELIEDLEIRREGYHYIESGFDESILKPEYKWMQNNKLLIGFSIHFQKQIKLAQLTGEYRSFWGIINGKRVDTFLKDVFGIDIECSNAV